MDDTRIAELLKPITPQLTSWKLQALAEWKAQHPDAVRVTLSETCRARFMHDRCIAYAETGPAIARVVPVGNMKCIVIEDGSDAIAISPKLIDGKTLRSSNYVTKTRRRMRRAGGFLFKKVGYIHIIWGHAIAEDMAGVNERVDQIWLTHEHENRAAKIAQLYAHRVGEVPFTADTALTLFEPVTVRPRLRLPRIEDVGMPKVGTDAQKKKRADQDDRPRKTAGGA